MATLKNMRKFAAVSKETQKNTKNSQSQNTPNLEMAEEYINQISEEIEERFTEKLSQEFNQTESRILIVLSKLDDFLLIPQVRTCSVNGPRTSGNNNSEN